MSKQSHQNKFHAATLQDLTRRFASLMENGEAMSADEQELWSYLAKLYEYSNKGIKGRGKKADV